jgi:hypothetical protein
MAGVASVFKRKKRVAYLTSRGGWKLEETHSNCIAGNKGSVSPVVFF